VFRSTTEGKVWLVSPGNSVAETSVREIDTSGSDTSSNRQLPRGFTPEAVVDAGLLGVMQPDPPPVVPWFAVWNPSTGTTTRIEAGNSFFAAAGSTLVTLDAVPSASRGVPLRLIDLTTGAARTVTPPSGTFFSGTGVMSPDGAVVFVLAATGGRAEWVAIDVASGRVTRLSGSASSRAAYPALGWSPHGQWYSFTEPGAHGRQRILGYRRGANALAEVKATVGPFDAAYVAPAT